MSKLYARQLRRHRCNARCRQPPLRYCRNWAVRGKTRCKFHGGMSTGPKTPEGKARVIAALVAGRRRWVERMKVEGRKFPGGRKPGVRYPKPLPPQYRQMTVAEFLSATADTTPRIPVRLPKRYRHMPLAEFLARGKEALKQLQERFEAACSVE
jgi:hypothetical protein